MLHARRTIAIAIAAAVPVLLLGGGYAARRSGLLKWGPGGGGGGGGNYTVINPNNYSAKGDAKIAWDGAMTSAPWIWTCSATCQPSGFIAAYANAAFDVTSSNSGTNSTTGLVANSVTTTAANDVLLSVYGYFQTGQAITGPNGTTTLASVEPGQVFNIYGFTQSIASAGATGNQTASSGGSNISQYAVMNVALKPSGGSIALHGAQAFDQNNSNNALSMWDPDGAQNGDFEVACFVFNTVNTPTITPPSGWTLIGTAGPAGGATTETTCYYRTSTSLPGNTLTSAGGSFSSSDVNKLICVGGVGNGTARVPVSSGTNTTHCGTIESYTSPTSVVLSFANEQASNISAQEYRYGTNNASAFSAVTAACASAGGCEVLLPAGMYATNAQLAFAGGVGNYWHGSERGSSEWQYGNTLNPKVQRTQASTGIWFLTTSLAGPAVSIAWSGQGVTDTAARLQMYSARLEHLDFVGGTSDDFTGGGNDGINVDSWSLVKFDDVGIHNFKNNCLTFTDVNGTYISEVQVEDSWIESCGNDDVYWNPGANAAALTMINNEVEAAVNHCIEFAAGAHGVAILGNIIQWCNWNNASSTAQIQGPSSGSNPWVQGIMAGNFFEQVLGGTVGNTPTFQQNADFVGLDTVHNYFNGNGQREAYSAAGTALPTCSSSSTFQHTPACVTDATACTNGTTYASSGSTACYVMCNGTNWIETGMGCY